MKLAYTRAMLNAALNGDLNHVAAEPDPVFRVAVPRSCPGVPPEYLDARGLWADKDAYDRAARELATRFRKNFDKFDDVSRDLAGAGPAA
jgi:phosphoenolpyruvate carboxykinase (ATP)